MKKIVLSFVLLSTFISNSVFALYTDDPYLNKQLYLDSANVYDAWDSSSGSSDVIVAVIDSGVDINHPDLKNNIWTNTSDDSKDGYPGDVHGWNFIDNNADVTPKIDVSCLAEKKCSLEGVNHGTVIAGVIAATANNREGIAGIANKTKIMPLKVLSPNGGGNVDDVVKAINYAVNHGASVINMSFVGDTDSALLKKTIKDATSSGVVFVVASGNNIEQGGTDLNEHPMYPICSDSVDDNFIIGVSAIVGSYIDKSDGKEKEDDSRATFANYGDNCVDVSAQGVSIFSTTVYKPQNSSFNSYYNGYWSGTSVATPIVSATAAIIKSINKNFTAKEVKDIIVDSASDLADKSLGKKINVAAAVKLAMDKVKANSGYLNVITGAGIGDSPVVKVFRDNGYEESSFMAFDKNFKGGVNVAYGGLNYDADDYIVASPASSGGPQVRIFDKTGNLKNQFFAFDKSFRGGLNLALLKDTSPFADSYIVAAQAFNGSGVKVLNYYGNIKSQFYPYDKNFKGGVNVATCNLDDGLNIVTSPVSGLNSEIKIFDENGKIKNKFFAFDSKYKGNITVGCLDYNSDGKDEIVVSSSNNNVPYFKVFDKNGVLLNQVSISDQKTKNSVNISGFYSSALSKYLVFVSPKNYGGPQIRIFDSNMKSVGQFFAYDKKMSGGVNFVVSDKILINN